MSSQTHLQLYRLGDSKSSQLELNHQDVMESLHEQALQKLLTETFRHNSRLVWLLAATKRCHVGRHVKQLPEKQGRLFKIIHSKFLS